MSESGVVERCVANQNSSGRISAGVSTTIQSNQVSSNGFFDISAGVGSLILDNVVNAFTVGIRGATPASAQVGSGGNVVTLGLGATGYDDVVHLYCDLASLNKLCNP